MASIGQGATEIAVLDGQVIDGDSPRWASD